ncbi:MAG: hypothetical protein ABSF03_05075 [Streptosporangiaceae bacterium]
MTDILGIDHDRLAYSAPLRITAPLPESVIQNAKRFHQVQVRKAWDECTAQGGIPEGDGPPPGSSYSEELAGAGIVGMPFGAMLGFFAQLVAGVAAGVWVGIIIAAAIIVGLPLWRDHVVRRDAARVEASQLEFDAPQDKSQITEAQRAAMRAIELWPRLPLPEKLLQQDLQQALWRLAEMIRPRDEYRKLLAGLRDAAIGLPASHSFVADIPVRRQNLDALLRTQDLVVGARLEKFNVLAAQCEQCHREQEAIKQAEVALNNADVTLGIRRTTTPERIDEDSDVLNRRIYSVLRAYQDLINSGSPTSETTTDD